MAKAPASDTPETTPDAAPAPAPAEGKKPRQAKAKPDAAPVAPAPAAAAPPSPEAGGAAPAPDGPTKRKGRQPGNPPRRGKRLRNQLKQQQQRVAKEGVVPLRRGITTLKALKRAKFDETVEVHMSLGIDVTHADQMIRGAVPLPHGVGKSQRVIVFCQGENVAKAKDAGADAAGGDDLIEKIQKENWLDFDVALSTQDMMGKVSRLGRALGPRGLMPSPKAGTVLTMGQDVGVAVREFKAGKVEFRADKGGNVHARVGKISFDDDKLADNITTFVEAIRAAKPTGVKGHYVKTITLSSTMTSPGVPVTV